MAFICSICGEPATQICARCTKDVCGNHLCEKCFRCSDCCECEVALREPSAAPFPTARSVAAPHVEPEAAAEEPAQPAPPPDPVPGLDSYEPPADPRPYGRG